MQKKLLFIVITITCLSMYGQTAAEYSEMAETKIKQEDYKYALVLIDKAIALDTKNPWYYLRKADIQFKLTGPLDAIEIVEKAIKIQPKEAESYNRAGMYYQSAGMADTAIALYNVAIKYADKDSTRNSYILNRGTAKAGKRDFVEALKDYETALRFNPNDIGTLNNIAPVYRELGQIDKGITCLKKIISIDSTFIGPYINLGFAYSKLDSLDKALEYFGKALIIDPKEALVYSNRGNTYYKKGEYKKALADINRSIELYPTNSYAYRNLALVYIALNNIEEACVTLSYARNYGFEQRYGSEVEELTSKYCKK